MTPSIAVIIPALNEAASVADVVRRIPRPPVAEIIVVDNGSTDATAREAAAAGARVVHEPRRGYGAACLRGLAALPADADVVVFLDADGSDAPELLPELVRPIADDRADLVIGSRVRRAEAGSLTAAQRAGNLLAANWLRVRYGLPATDLGPFRAIRRTSLERLAMGDRDYGWTVEMQIKAARHGLRYAEVDVPYRPRVGRSKISGTVRGVIGASFKILGWLAAHDPWMPRRRGAADGGGR